MPASAALMVVYNYVEAGHLWYKFLDVLGIQRLFSKQLLLSKLTLSVAFALRSRETGVVEKLLVRNVTTCAFLITLSDN